uniref:C2H2-type domain-containing protein n=1 Tax=Esox lucius TaxID=8010 RepID=A0AAY5KDS7_ESOLU
MAEPNGNPQPEVFLGIAENQTQVDSRTCQVCGKILTFASQMERHLKSHSRARPYNCATCERSFKYKDSLKKHQEILGHEGILEDFDQGVEEQQAELNTESYNPLLTKENDTVASTTDGNPGEAPKPHTCTVCGKVLDCAGHLATHMRSHSEERPYQCTCEVCGKSFTRVTAMRRHQLTHTGDLKFKCLSCEKCFRDSHDLKRHQRRKLTLGDLSQDGGQNVAEPNGSPKPEVFLGTAENETQVDSRTCHVCGKSFTFASQMESPLLSYSGHVPIPTVSALID